MYEYTPRRVRARERARSASVMHSGQLALKASPFFGYLPEPSEAITNLMRTTVEQGRKIASLTVAHLEAPSNYLAFPELVV